MKKILLLIFALLSLTACSTHIGNFSAFSTGTYRGENIDAQHLVKSNAEGSSCRTWFLFIPFGAHPKLDQAASEALSEMNGDFMANARLYDTWWSVILFSGGCYKLQGDVYRTLQ